MAEQAVLGIRERVAGASRQISRVKRIDKVARLVIVLGGISVVLSVLGILVFIGAEAVPLFRAATHSLGGTIGVGDAPGPVRALGADEHQTYVYRAGAAGSVAFYRVNDAQLDREVPVAGLEQAVVTAASRSLDDRLALGTNDGRVALTRVSFERRYEGETFAGVDVELETPTIVALDARRRPIDHVTYRASDFGRAVAGVVGNELLLWQEGVDGATTASLWAPTDEKITAIQLGGTERLVAGTDRGRVYHWELGTPPRLTDISPVSSRPVTAVDWIIGDSTFIAGTEAGEVSAWFRTRLTEDDEDLSMVRAHVFEPQGAAITAIAPSSRGRSFVTASADGSAVVRHTTSERTAVSISGGGSTGADAVLLAPKADAVFVARGSAVTRYPLDNPHPEITGRTLFGRVWYEGYAKPDYVWQSTGGTDDFEPKFSLYPLMFGTIKGTVYALLFAVPIAVLAALYTSQFAHPVVRDRVKPAVEIMAALPSVVIGFLAGLWLASLVERVVVSVLLMFVLLPVIGTAGVFLWRALPASISRRLRPGSEVFVIVPLLVFGGWLALQLGPGIEAALFQGDFKAWLASSLGLTYDQRNCLVVGLAMGFAVIPIIFTISEDAFSNVPSNLTAASLALGASRWQTAVRIVLPTASPGVFSAIMVGFGRAVGETMIVLMATGNTPVLDWSLFNGMRTLSANIAVEIPEAPHGDTLYRTLFLSAALLFAMTFTVNTIAELIRQRLRQKYRAL